MYLIVIRSLIATVLLIGLSVAHANDKIAYQNWAVEIGPETTEAYTANESASTFGLFCGGTTCVFYLKPNLNCVPNTKNSVLMNTGITSAALGMQCTQIGQYYFQILDPFDVVLNALKLSLIHI